MKIYDYENLEVYKLAFKLQQKIFELSKSFPKEERYSLTDQIRRSSRSIGANIAEAWGKRKYIAHFQSKLSDSDSEKAETQHWLKTAFYCKYINKETYVSLMEEYKHVGGMLGNMINNAAHWCSSLK